jgi:5-bromo-4-chloroindolyl phosphate hydrolysis protein
VAGFAIVSAFVKKKYPDEYVEEKKKPEPEPEKKETSHGEVVDGIIAEGRTAQKELGRLYASISNVEVKKKIRDIMEVSDKIVQDAIDDPSDVPQIKKFLDYYLPTTIKLLNAYDRMGAQGIDGENISGTMSSIEQMLDTAIEAYKKLLDSLFANQAMDIETDIDVMNTLLKREGLAGDGGAGFRQ